MPPLLKIQLTGSVRRVFKLSLDLCLVIFAYWAAFALRFDGIIPEAYLSMCRMSLPVILVVYTVLFIKFGIYRGLWKYASIRDMVLIALSSTAGCLLLYFIIWLWKGILIPRSILVIFWILVIVATGSARLIHRIYSIYWPLLKQQNKRVIIVGAGNSGEMIVRQMFQDRQLPYQPIGFVDDNPKLKGTRIHDLPVLGTLADIPKLVKSKRADEVLLAIPSATAKQMRRAVQYCEEAGVPFQTLPGLKELINGNVSLSKIRKVQIEDLLERAPNPNDSFLMAKHFSGKVVMVTGAAGSIGSELCRQLINLRPKQLLMLDRAESDLYELDHDLRFRNQGPYAAVSIIADITNEEKIRAICKTFRPEIVFHAAAYKHVPMMENFPEEAVRNNVFGTINVYNAVASEGAERFVLISSDKAVNPTSVMGATKRVNELFCVSKNTKWDMKSVVVRFGNVLASRGSVVPLFQQQIRNGGPVTVTSMEIERFFMTISEAVELVLQAGSLGEGGEIFVLDMGEPIKIYDMARHLVTLSGFKPDEDIEIKITGLRPGEKLYEELWSGEEKPRPTTESKIMQVTNTLARKNNFSRSNLSQLKKAVDRSDQKAIRRVLSNIVQNARLLNED